MLLFKEACRQLRHTAPKTVPRPQAANVSPSCHLQLWIMQGAPSWRKPSSWQTTKSVRRSFSATAGMDHGHITPPKPGEEYVTALTVVYINIHFYTKMLSFFVGSTSRSLTRTVRSTIFRYPRVITCWTLPRPMISRWKVCAFLATRALDLMAADTSLPICRCLWRILCLFDMPRYCGRSGNVR